jgi:hypothetical protein
MSGAEVAKAGRLVAAARERDDELPTALLGAVRAKAEELDVPLDEL